MSNERYGKWEPLSESSHELTRLTCDQCNDKVTKLTNIGTGRCVCDSCVADAMNRRLKWHHWLSQGETDINKLP